MYVSSKRISMGGASPKKCRITGSRVVLVRAMNVDGGGEPGKNSELSRRSTQFGIRIRVWMLAAAAMTTPVRFRPLRLSRTRLSWLVEPRPDEYVRLLKTKGLYLRASHQDGDNLVCSGRINPNVPQTELHQAL